MLVLALTIFMACGKYRGAEHRCFRVDDAIISVGEIEWSRWDDSELWVGYPGVRGAHHLATGRTIYPVDCESERFSAGEVQGG